MAATERPRGPRARTRERLRDAFLHALAERGYERLRIGDVLALAGVGRSTFYEHFRDKDALFDSALARLAQDLARAGASDPRPFGFVGALLEHVSGQRALFSKLTTSRSGTLVLERLRRIVRAQLAAELAREGAAGGTRFELAVEHAAAGLFGIIEAWLRHYPEVPASEIERAFLRFTRSGTSGAAQEPGGA